jgi:hypothetical protein
VPEEPRHPQANATSATAPIVRETRANSRFVFFVSFAFFVVYFELELPAAASASRLRPKLSALAIA